MLLDAAESGGLSNDEGVLAQTERMLADPRAQPAILDFYDQWLGLRRLATISKSAVAYPEFDDALRSDMREEAHRFVQHVLTEDDGRLETLLTANYSFVNGRLASLYGLAAPADPSAYVKTEFDPGQRAGILTQLGVLTAFARTDESSPVKRGVFVRTRILCQDLPDPPAVVPELPELAEGTTNRERFAMHSANPGCVNCHSLIDGLGFGFEHYDGIGRYRTMNVGLPVDARGSVTSTSDANGDFDGVPALAQRLAESEQVQNCIATQWFRYASGRREESADDCSIAAVQKSLADSGGDLRSMMTTLIHTNTFTTYRPAD
jgi:hypothetical protein